MAIVIKEIEVKTVVEKRVVDRESISDELYNRLKESIIEELELRGRVDVEERRRRER